MFGNPVTNPKGWEVRRLGDLVAFVGGGTPSRARPEYFTGEICWATSKDIRAERLSGTQEHITEDAVKQSATNIVPPGSVLVVVKSKVLMHRLPVAIADVPVCFGQDLKGLMIKNDVIGPEYLLRCLKLSERLLLDRARGANTEGLTLDHLRSVLIPLAEPRTLRGFELMSTKARATLARERKAGAVCLTEILAQKAFAGEL